MQVMIYACECGIRCVRDLHEYPPKPCECGASLVGRPNYIDNFARLCNELHEAYLKRREEGRDV